MNRDVGPESKDKKTTARVSSLLNPESVHSFFYDYDTGNYDRIKKRFNLTSNEQAEALR